MKDLKKIKLLKIGIFFLILSSLVIGVQSFETQEGFMSFGIYNPFGILLNPSSENSNEPPTILLKSGSTSSPGTVMNINIKSNSLDLMEFKNDNNFNKKTTCIIGGNYYTTLESNPRHSGITKINKSVFYCKTTKNLFDSIKIPSDWNNDEIIVYCNDGGLINSEINNIAFLTSQIDSYKNCIIKNLNKEKTIIAGYEVGNSEIDSDSEFFYNTVNHSNRFIDSNNFNFKESIGNIEVFENLNDGKTYYFNYEHLNSNPLNQSDLRDRKFSITDFNPIQNNKINLNEIFPNFNENRNESRIALFRKLSNGKIYYGFEKPLNLITKNNDDGITPVYIIQSFGELNQNLCEKTLSKYNAKLKPLGYEIKNTDSVICSSFNLHGFQINQIKINSKQIDSNDYGSQKGDSFNLFKNIILGAN